MSMCETCAVRGQSRCPYQKEDVPVAIEEHGCANYIKRPRPFNINGMKSRCIQCRYLFRKSRAEQGDKSFIMCGAIPSQVQRIQPIVCCPNFKPMRKKQFQKRWAKQGKAPYNPRQSWSTGNQRSEFMGNEMKHRPPQPKQGGMSFGGRDSRQGYNRGGQGYNSGR